MPTISRLKNSPELPCSMPMILRLDLLQNLWQVFTCVEYAHNFKAKKIHQIYGKILPSSMPMILRLELLQNLWQI